MHIHRNKYDTTIPWLYSQNKECLLPSEFRETIPCSTVFFWRNNPKPFYGSEFSNIRTESLEWYELLHERNHLQKTLKIIAKVWIGFFGYFDNFTSKNEGTQRAFSRCSTTTYDRFS